MSEVKEETVVTDADVGGVVESTAADNSHKARLRGAMKRNASFASQEVQAELLAMAASVDTIKAELGIK